MAIQKIKSLTLYRELERLAIEKKLVICFYEVYNKSLLRIQLYVGFEVKNENNNLISVPRESKYWDDLFNLITDTAIYSYNRLTKKTTWFNICDDDEFIDDLKKITEYIKDSY